MTAEKTSRGPFGDARPDDVDNESQDNRTLPPEDVEIRENVSTVTPEDYPASDRADSRP